MKKAITYNQAFAQLEEIVDQLEEGEIELEALPAKIHEANALIAVCELKLRNTVTEAAQAGTKFTGS
ncbi:MAG: exodeoxyribonuclease VII small subunit [Chitinophagaceae bacterium]